MAVPKRHLSKARRDKRRSNVWKLEAPALVKCSNCGSLKLPHQACGNCGYYKGEEVIKKAYFAQNWWHIGVMLRRGWRNAFPFFLCLEVKCNGDQDRPHRCGQ